MRKIISFGLASMLVFSLLSCDSDSKNARIEVWLTDAPGDYDEVNVDIKEVQVHSEEGEQSGGWKSIAVNPGVINLIELTNGLDTLLGSIEVPAGKISQIRLKLGNENSLKIGEETFDLSTPSGQQSGLKLQVHETLAEGITYKILLDFDAARSIVKKGNGEYSLKPVIRTITKAQDGAIRGIVTPIESTPAIYAIVGEDTLGTTYADETGKFLIRGLAPGTYTVTFEPKTGYLPVQKDGVAVALGNVTDVGQVQINQ